jgi:hypothetical protein
VPVESGLPTSEFLQITMAGMFVLTIAALLSAVMDGLKKVFRHRSG